MTVSSRSTAARPRPTRRFTSPLAAVLLAAGCDRASGGTPAPPPAAAQQAGATAMQPRGYRCGASLAPDPRQAEAEIRRSYAEWKRRYVTPAGAGGLLRVRMPGHGRDRTSSEAIGYGMLLAVYRNDRAAFDGLWRYARHYRNPRGLMAWDVSPQGRVLDDNSATDGDQDMAFALVVADGRWGGYRREAEALIGSLWRHNVEADTYVLKPGDVWGGSNVTNPSYFAPAYYRVFAAYTGERGWLRVVDTSYAVMARVNARRGRATGLQPEWTTAAGDSAGPEHPFDFHYGYNANRVPWRLAMDAAWNCEPRARRHLELLNAFFRRVGPTEIRDGYTLEGRVTGRWHNASFVAPAMAGAIVSPDPRFRRAMWDHTVELRDDGYYHDALRLLALVFASGGMPPPAPSAPPAAAAPRPR